MSVSSIRLAISSREPLAACAVGVTLMGVLLFLIFDRSAEMTPPGLIAAATAPAAASSNAPALGQTQQLGQLLFTDHLISLELAGLILTVAMIGAIVIARRRIVTPSPHAEADVVTAPATPIDDNPHSIPVYGTDNPRQKEYPET